MIDSGSLLLKDEQATVALAERWAPEIRAFVAESDTTLLMTLRGELGAGKSAFVRALLQALGHQGPVPSPTYTLVESYTVEGLRIAHADLYRLADPDELDYIGFDEVVSQHDWVCVEWPERAGERLSEGGLDVRFEYVASGGRQLFVAGSLANAELASRLFTAEL